MKSSVSLDGKISETLVPLRVTEEKKEGFTCGNVLPDLYLVVS